MLALDCCSFYNITALRFPWAPNCSLICRREVGFKPCELRSDGNWARWGSRAPWITPIWIQSILGAPLLALLWWPLALKCSSRFLEVRFSLMRATWHSSSIRRRQGYLSSRWAGLIRLSARTAVCHCPPPATYLGQRSPDWQALWPTMSSPQKHRWGIAASGDQDTSGPFFFPETSTVEDVLAKA